MESSRLRTKCKPVQLRSETIQSFGKPLGLLAPRLIRENLEYTLTPEKHIASLTLEPRQLNFKINLRLVVDQIRIQFISLEIRCI